MYVNCKKSFGRNHKITLKKKKKKRVQTSYLVMINQSVELFETQHKSVVYERLTGFAVTVRTCGECGGDRLCSSMFCRPHLCRVMKNRRIGR